MPKKRSTAKQPDEDVPLIIEAQTISSDEEPLDDVNSDVSDGDGEDIRAAISEYLAAAEQHAGEAEQPADGNGHVADPGSDSSEDEERPHRNTVGDVPLRWYKDEDHIGYDLEGSKIGKKARGDKLDALLARNDSSKALRTIYDEYNDEEIELSKEELAMVMRIRKGQFPNVEVNPYEPYVDWFTSEPEVHPINNAPEPKRRFIPSKWEEQKIVKLVRAMRKGWLKSKRQQKAAAEPPVYMLWGDEEGQGTGRSASGLSYIPPAKPKLPGNEESYNPSKEYLPTEEELAGYELLDESERPSFVPRAFDSLRHVPAYASFIKDRFERCLDLYLCPRVLKKRMFIDPQTLVPKLPKPSELHPFPTTLAVQYKGHSGKVWCVAPHPGGQWLATGSSDGSLKLWEVSTGRCQRTWQLRSSSSSSRSGAEPKGGADDGPSTSGRDAAAAVAPVYSVAWCPNQQLQVLAAVVGKQVVLLPTGLGGQEAEAAAAAALQSAVSSSSSSSGSSSGLASWSAREGGGVEVTLQHPVRYVTWHSRGDYFATVAPTGGAQSVVVHQLSKGASQSPFRRNRGRVTRVAFHPTKPFFFVATQNHVRIYNLAKQGLAKKLVGGSGVITCLAVHPSGDHVLVGAEDKRLAWYDLDLSATPYKALRYHTYAVRGAAYHSAYPLFASSSDDGTVHVFHGRVYNDLMTNPLIVPVKILRGHSVVDSAGVLDVAFHPHQPWLFSAGADGNACLYSN